MSVLGRLRGRDVAGRRNALSAELQGGSSVQEAEGDEKMLTNHSEGVLTVNSWGALSSCFP